MKNSYEKRCSDVKDYIKKYYENAYILRRDNLRKIYDEEYSKLLDQYNDVKLVAREAVKAARAMQHVVKD